MKIETAASSISDCGNFNSRNRKAPGAAPVAKTLSSPRSGDAVIVSCLPSAPLPSSPASRFIPSTRDHCGTLRVPSRFHPCGNPGSRKSLLTRLRRGDCADFAKPKDTDSEFAYWRCDHLRRPRGALGCSAPYSPADSRTRRCGCADHHGEAQRTAPSREHFC